MRKCGYTVVLAGVLAVAAGPLVGQEKNGAGGQKPLEFQGTARVNAHRFPVKKGETYRVTVKAEGFVPLLQVVDEFGPLASVQGRGPGARVVLTAEQTREYTILVDLANQSQVQNGAANRYSLTVERATFAPEDKAQHSLQLNDQAYPMQAGRFYFITVRTRAFEPDVRIARGDKVVLAKLYEGPPPKAGPNPEHVVRFTYVPDKTGTYRILVSVGPYSKLGKAPLDYSLDVAERKPTLSVQEQIAAADPLYQHRQGRRHKAFPVKLEAGRTYQIDMISSALDAYLFLEDAAGNVLAQDDDGGGGHNARIVFRPQKTDTYRVIATTYGQGETGAFQLAVIESPDARPVGSPPGARPRQQKP